MCKLLHPIRTHTELSNYLVAESINKSRRHGDDVILRLAIGINAEGKEHIITEGWIQDGDKYTDIERCEPQTKLSLREKSNKGNNVAIDTKDLLEKCYNTDDPDNPLFRAFTA